MLDGEPEDLRQIRRRWGVLFQAGALFSTLTVAENVQVPLREYYRLDEALLDDIAAYKISMAGLTPDAGPKYPSELSGRSEEHTSELQSLMRTSYAVFCLKKQKTNTKIIKQIQKHKEYHHDSTINTI